MKAVKENKVYHIDESQKKAYQDRGFDIIDGDTVVAYGRGKTVPYDEYAKLAGENVKLQKELGELRAAAKTEVKEEKPEKKSTNKKAGE